MGTGVDLHASVFSDSAVNQSGKAFRDSRTIGFTLVSS